MTRRNVTQFRPTARRQEPLFLFDARRPTAAASAEMIEQVITHADIAVRLSGGRLKLRISHEAIETLQAQGVTKFQDLTGTIPNFTVSQSPISDVIAMRGINSDLQAAGEQAVATFVDGVYRGRGVQSRFAFLDMGMLEVVRGPQGTLFGKNTVGGALNISSAKPTAEFDGSASVSREFEQGETEALGFISGPVNDSLRQFELPQVTQQQVKDWIGHGTRELLAQALSCSLGSAPAAVRDGAPLAGIVAAFESAYQRRCGRRSQLYPDVRETLLALRARGVKTAVVTNKEGRFTASVLRAHQLPALFDLVISGDTLPSRKPDSAGIAHCLAHLGVARERALFVGDSSIDVATARNAGVAVWALPYGYNLGRPIAASAPDRLIASCAELLAC